jgi:hypothetical protein
MIASCEVEELAPDGRTCSFQLCWGVDDEDEEEEEEDVEYGGGAFGEALIRSPVIIVLAAVCEEARIEEGLEDAEEDDVDVDDGRP